MATNIKCPKCGNQFDAEEVIAADLEQKLQQQYQQKLQQSLDTVEAEKKQLQEAQQKFDETRKNANEIFAQKLQQEKQKLETELQEQLRKSIAADFENQLKMLETNNKDNEDKTKNAHRNNWLYSSNYWPYFRYELLY